MSSYLCGLPSKFCNSRSSPSRDIRVPHFVTNDDDDAADDAGVRRSPHKGKTHYGVLHKNGIHFTLDCYASMLTSNFLCLLHFISQFRQLNRDGGAAAPQCEAWSACDRED